MTDLDTLCVYGSIWPPSTLLLRASLFMDVGGFDTSLRHQEDWDLTIRLAARQEIAFIDLPVVQYRRHSTNATLDGRKALIGRAVVRTRLLADRNKYGIGGTLRALYLRAALRGILRAVRAFAKRQWRRGLRDCCDATAAAWVAVVPARSTPAAERAIAAWLGAARARAYAD